MREIKFRAWQPHPSLHRKPGMYEVESLEFYPQHGGGEAFIKESDSKQAKSSEFFEDIVLMQYTGLKDKNGVEIYEGGVIKQGSLVEGAVEYGDCSGGGPDEGFRTMGFYIKNGYYEKGLLDIDEKYIEVIGNIYENPDLLEANK